MTRKITDMPVWITGIGQKTTSAGFTKNMSFSSMESTKIASNAALKMANQNIQNIDVAEVHDAFSVCEPMALESMGFSDSGCGTSVIRRIQTSNILGIYFY